MRGRYAPSGFSLGRVWSPPFGCRMPACRLAPLRFPPPGDERVGRPSATLRKTDLRSSVLRFLRPSASGLRGIALKIPVSRRISHPSPLRRQRPRFAGFATIRRRRFRVRHRRLAKCWRSRPLPPSAPCRYAGPACAASRTSPQHFVPPSRRSCLFGPVSTLNNVRNVAGIAVLDRSRTVGRLHIK